MAVYEATEESTVELCPVKNCRLEATDEMWLYGVHMFSACTKHANQIRADNWYGWQADLSEGVKYLTIYYDEAKA